MAIDPKLLVIKPVDELTEVTGLQDGDLLFYDGSGNLKRISIDTFNNLSKTAKPLKPTDTTPTVEGLYMPTEIGTYTNAGGLVAEDGFDTLFYFDGANWTKRALPYPQASQNLRIYEDLPNGTVLNKKEQVISKNVTYIVKDGETAVVGTDLPADSTKFEPISDKETSLRSIKYSHETNAALMLTNGTDISYSDSDVGNLGTPFTFSALVSFNELTAGSFNIIEKGDSATNGWKLFVNNTGLVFVVNGVSKILTLNITQNTLFLTVTSDANSTHIFAWGNLIYSTNATTTATTALRINPSTAFGNEAWIHYLSVSKRKLNNFEISEELNKITENYAVNEIDADFVGNAVNLSNEGFKWTNNQFDGTAVVASKAYPTLQNVENDIIASVTDSTVESTFLNENNTVVFNTNPANKSAVVSDFFNVENYSQLEIYNAIDNTPFYNAFYDKNFNPISIQQTADTGYIATIVAKKTITVPNGAVYARVMLGYNGYVKGINTINAEKPKFQKNDKKEAISIERIAPVVYDGIFDTISPLTPNVYKLYTVVSATSNDITISASDMDTFPFNGELYPMAIKDDVGNYHFQNVIADKPNNKLLFEKPINYTPVKFQSVYDTTIAQQGQHLSPYGGRCLGERIVEALQDFKSYKHLGSVGFIAQSGNIARFENLKYKLIDESDNAFADLSVVDGLEVLNYQTNDDWTYKYGFSSDNAISLKGTTTASQDFANFKLKTPIKTMWMEIVLINPIGTMPQSGYVAASSVNIIITNNGVEIYNEKVKTLAYEKIALNRTDWGNVEIKLKSNEGGNTLVFIKGIQFFKVDALQELNPINSNAVVAVIGDSWGVFPGANDITLEPTEDFTVFIDPRTGIEDASGTLGYMPKLISSKSGAIVDNWCVGGMTASWGYSQMWEIFQKKRYTHCVISFFTNDNNLSTHRIWEGYIRMMVKMCITQGIQPIIVAPMGTASPTQKINHGRMSNLIREGIFGI